MDPQSSDEYISDGQMVEQVKSSKKIRKINLKEVPEIVKKLYQSRGEINTDYLIKNFGLKNPKNMVIGKQVCSKILVKQQLIVECYECRFDSTCVICMQCFKNGNHQGHKYVVKKAGGGCCDCGDKQAWKQSGFCKNHSGNSKQFQISHEYLIEAKQKLHALLYMYFYLRLTKDKNSSQYFSHLLNYLMSLNQQNVYFNKITTLCFNEKLSNLNSYRLRSQFDRNTVLQNILTYKLCGKDIHEWTKLFCAMFSYYPFKQLLLSCYIKNHGRISIGTQDSSSCAGSISCQLLTSHELVNKYSRENQIGINQNQHSFIYNSQNQNKSLIQFYSRIFYDLGYINKLKGNAPLQYWKMYINNPKSLQSIFQYYKLIYSVHQKSRMNGISNIAIIVKTVQLSYVQEQTIELFAQILRVIAPQKYLMESVIIFLWKKCNYYMQKDPNFMCIFRPYQRCLGLILFSLFNCRLQQVVYKKTLIFKQILKIKESKFDKFCLYILSKMLKTYLFYTKTIAEVGLGQSLYVYINLYKLKYHLWSSTDIVCLKVLLLLLKNDLELNIGGFINLNSEQVDQDKIKQKKVYLSSVMNFLKYLYVSCPAQATITCQIIPGNKLYQRQISDILQRFFNERNGCVSIQTINILKRKVFSYKIRTIDQWLKQNCTINKQKKQFIKKIPSDKRLNVQDLWENQLVQNVSFADPFKTIDLIKGYNLKIFYKIWAQKTVVSLVKAIQILYGTNQNGIQLVLSNILHIYLLKKQNNQQKQAQILYNKAILPYINFIPAEIKSKIIQATNQEQQVKKESETLKQQLKKRKTKIEQLKLKKMQKFKQGQQKFLNMQNQNDQNMQILKMDKIQSKQSFEFDDQNQQAYSCCICKNDKKQDLLYLARIDVSNLQDFYQLGSGVRCLSFNTCYHTFDYNCLKNIFQQQDLKFSIKCPLCKIWFQLMVPIVPFKSKEKQTQMQLQNSSEISLTNRIYFLGLQIFAQQDQSNMSVISQIIKSCYHFALTCYSDPKNFSTKKCILYQNILSMIRSCMKIDDIKKQLKQMMKQYQTKQTQMIQQGTKEVIKKRTKRNQYQMQFQLPMVLQKNQQFQHKLKSKTFFQMWLQVFQQFLQDTQRNQSYQFINLEKYSQDQNIRFLRICAKKIFKQKISYQQLCFIQQFPRKRCRQIIKVLPEKYSQISLKKQCHQCKQVKPQMHLCLMCHWIGCNIKKTQRHTNKKHSCIGVYMQIQSSIVFYESFMGRYSIGQIYENNWGHQLIKNEKWDQFQLNQNKLKQIQNNLLNGKLLPFQPKNY